MGEKSNIQWTDGTWNIARGCTKVDEDCKFCYMYRDSFDSTRYNPLEVVRTKTVFTMPLKYKETKSKVRDGNPLIFTSSLTDVFHPAIDYYRNEMWDIIRKCPHLTFQILTKRPERITEQTPADMPQADNIWFGTSVGSPDGIERLHHLIIVDCKIKFVSLEPLYGKITLFPLLNLTIEARTGKPGSAIDWVIVGGESGNEKGKYRYRECKLEWIENIVDECKKYNVPVFVKQLDTYLAKGLQLSDRHGGNINEFPKHLQVREFPTTLNL